MCFVTVVFLFVRKFVVSSFHFEPPRVGDESRADMYIYYFAVAFYVYILFLYLCIGSCFCFVCTTAPTCVELVYVRLSWMCVQALLYIHSPL